MATVSARCSVPGGADYYMLYNDITIESSDYPQLSGVKGDDLIRCMQFLVTRQIFLWQLAIGFLTLDQYKEKIKLVEQLVPEIYRTVIVVSQKKVG